MVETELDPIEHAFAEGTPIDQAIEEGVQQALRRHKRAGNPIVVWQRRKDALDHSGRYFSSRRPSCSS